MTHCLPIKTGKLILNWQKFLLYGVHMVYSNNCFEFEILRSKVGRIAQFDHRFAIGYLALECGEEPLGAFFHYRSENGALGRTVFATPLHQNISYRHFRGPHHSQLDFDLHRNGLAKGLTPIMSRFYPYLRGVFVKNLDITIFLSDKTRVLKCHLNKIHITKRSEKKSHMSSLA